MSGLVESSGLLVLNDVRAFVTQGTLRKIILEEFLCLAMV
jgi:hypothetical protein